MIYCPYCKVKISTKTNVCPLCHTDLIAAGVSVDEIKRTETAFPKRAKLPPLSTNLFDKIYLLVAINVAIVAIFVEAMSTKHVRIAWIISALLLYFYLFLRVTLRSDDYFPQKVTGQAILLSVVVFSTRAVLPEPRIIFEYILPTIYLVSMIIIGIYMFINYKKPNKFLLNLISIALLSVLPYIIVKIAHTKAELFALITASIGGVICVTSVIIYAKPLIAELKRKFHT